jgi:hypothetical protein
MGLNEKPVFCQTNPSSKPQIRLNPTGSNQIKPDENNNSLPAG